MTPSKSAFAMVIIHGAFRFQLLRFCNTCWQILWLFARRDLNRFGRLKTQKKTNIQSPNSQPSFHMHTEKETIKSNMNLVIWIFHSKFCFVVFIFVSFWWQQNSIVKYIYIEYVIDRIRTKMKMAFNLFGISQFCRLKTLDN